MTPQDFGPELRPMTAVEYADHVNDYRQIFSAACLELRDIAQALEEVNELNGGIPTDQMAYMIESANMLTIQIASAFSLHYACHRSWTSQEN